MAHETTAHRQPLHHHPLPQQFLNLFFTIPAQRSQYCLRAFKHARSNK